jgi:hypothetical protein
MMRPKPFRHEAFHLLADQVGARPLEQALCLVADENDPSERVGEQQGVWGSGEQTPQHIVGRFHFDKTPRDPRRHRHNDTLRGVAPD